MAHNIQGRDIQVGLTQAWHGLTTVVDRITSNNCGINYPMGIEQAFFQPDGLLGELIKANGMQIYSKDDCLPVGKTVSKHYKLIENSEMWDAVAAGLEGTGATIMSCGTVDNRAKGFISVKATDDIIAAGRDTKPYLSILWGHGGNMPVIAQTGFTVVVCENTYTMVQRAMNKSALRIKHHSKANIGSLTQYIEEHIGVVAQFKAAMDSLATIPCETDKAQAMYYGLVGAEGRPLTKNLKTRIKQEVGSLLLKYQCGKGNAGETMADWFNGATDFYTHQPLHNKTRWAAYKSSEFGEGAKRKQFAYTAATNPALSQYTEQIGRGIMNQYATN